MSINDLLILALIFILIITSIYIYYFNNSQRKNSTFLKIPKSNDIEAKNDYKPKKEFMKLSSELDKDLHGLKVFKEDFEEFSFNLIKENKTREESYKNVLIKILDPLDGCNSYLNHLKDLKPASGNIELEKELKKEIKRITAIKISIENILQDEGVILSTSIGDKFDHRLHKSITNEIKADSTIKSIKIQGYFQNDDVLRLAEVELNFPEKEEKK